MASKPVVAEGRVTLPFGPDELWPYVSDTDRLDKAVGLPKAHFIRGEAGRDERDVGEYKLGGVSIAKWIENPFEWERPRKFAVEREYLSGPIRRFYGGTELLPAEAGSTTVHIFAEFEPRSPIFRPLLARFLAPASVQRGCQQYEAIGAFLAKNAAIPFPKLVQARTPANSERLRSLLKWTLDNGGAPEAAELIRRLLEDAPDEDVAGMRPLALAEAKGLEPQRALETFLRATVAGILEMRWEMLCPGCKGVKADAAHLSELQATAHCDACNLDFTANVDELIEARFYPARAIRDVDVGTYCVSGPGKTQHRLMQALLQPGETRSFRLAMYEGNFVLRSPQTRGLAELKVSSGSTQATFEGSFDSTSLVPDGAYLASGEVTFRLANGTSRRLTITLDDAHTTVGAATPSRLMTLPTFQSLFSAEALAPGVELHIRRVGLLFTDLAGSTALYERVGDARAFRLVTEHFAILRQAIEAAGGAVIKTIGDAIMAAFPDGRSGIEAALAIQRDILQLDPRDSGVDPSRLVKVGVHSGPCFAVTQNERLDYFGTAVNVAARAQHEARGGEIVLTQEAFAECAALLDGHTVERFSVELRGITGPVPLIRIPAAG
jgi:class 3 adenylate cyclase/ribosome-associated toxin RatA of RatAB toxin-antitoxin module